MIFLSLYFVFFVAVLLVVYYCLPLRWRWVALLAGSLIFYLYAAREAFPILTATVLLSYGASRLLYYLKEKKVPVSTQRIILVFSIFVFVAPLFVIKEGNYILQTLLGKNGVNLIVPLGISFYTMQIIAYLTDIYRGDVLPERNFFRYALFVTWFPQIVEGPIPRFEQLGRQLQAEKSFDEKGFTGGFQLVLWGSFLKLMIADKAGVIVDTVFGAPELYGGGM
ncbi:MAG: hypothetical protein LIO67_06785 [Lachnospiraceae bacterium]|nr:hypothetical protein [Lachnospiraceae bacterium]